MRAFVSWLVIHLLVFTLVGGGIHLWMSAHPVRVLVGVNASYAMGKKWHVVKTRLSQLNRRGRYHQFSVVTDKGYVHGWQSNIDLSAITPYGPLDLAGISAMNRFDEFDQADERILVSSKQDAGLASVPGWTLETY